MRPLELLWAAVITSGTVFPFSGATISPEFLLVDLVNELGDLAEDRDAVLSRVREKAKEMDSKKLSRAVSLYGKYSTQKKFQEMLQRA
jgi:hypothetical protein